MHAPHRKWEIHGYLAPETAWIEDGELINTGAYEPVAVIFDPRGWEWHVTLQPDRGDGRRPQIASLLIKSTNGRPVDQAALRAVPTSYIADAAASFLASFGATVEDDYHTADALAMAASEPGGVHLPGDPPPPEEFAAVWKSTPPVTVQGRERIPRRELLAEHYSVSVWAIDKWARRARDLNLLPAAAVGRRRASSSTKQTSGANRRPANTK